MNSHLPSTFQSTYSRSAAANAVDALSGTASAAKSGTESDAQAFSRWMAQHREAQGGAQGNASAPAAPQPVRPPTAVTANRPQISAQSNPTAKSPERNPPDDAEASSPQKMATRAPGKPASKPVAAKAPETPRRESSIDEAGQVDGKVSELTAQASVGEEVNFRTTQGEATAWVKELQPPADLSAGDPAAMLAWLASLAQAVGMATEGGVDPSAGGAEVNLTGALSSAEGTSRTDLSDRGWFASSTMPGWSSGAGQSSGGQSGGADQERAGALTLEGLLAPASETSLDPSAAAAFGNLMNRELQRTGDLDASVAAATHHTGTLSTPLDSPQFPKALTDQLKVWLSGDATQGPMTAELRLNPAEMGPIHIKIALEGQTAQVDFAAAALETRQAIEASLPMLSSVLEEAGLSLSGGGVSDQSQQSAWGDAQRDTETPRGPSGQLGERSAGLHAGQEGAPMRSVAVHSSRPGGLDLYA